MSVGTLTPSLAAPRQETKYDEREKSENLRVVLSGVNEMGSSEELTRANGDGTAQVTLECLLPPGQAQECLDSIEADELVGRMAARLGVVKPAFEFEAPRVWVVSENGDMLTPTQKHSGRFTYRRTYRFKAAV